MDVKVLDTYVLWEIAIGNPKFIHYLEEDFVVNDFSTWYIRRSRDLFKRI